MSKVIEPLTKDQLEAWAKELESGNYAQGVGSLCTNGCYCCLGVLADMRGELTERNTFRRSRQSNYGLLASELSNLYYYLPGYRQGYLASLNDKGRTFSEIAQYIREKLIPEASK